MHVQEAIIRQKKTSRRPADRSSIAGSCMGNQSPMPFWARAMKRWELAWVPKNYGRRTCALITYRSHAHS